MYTVCSKGLHRQESLITMPWWMKVSYSVFFLFVSAQVSIPLPWTPVPITGQTLAVFCLGLCLGPLAAISVGVYWGLGLCGLPVLANCSAGTLLSPSWGYLFGMVLAAELIYLLSRREFARTWWGMFGILCCGEAVIMLLGNFILSYFVTNSGKSLLQMGFWPFIPGDLIKMVIATTLSYHYRKYFVAEKSEMS